MRLLVSLIAHTIALGLYAQKPIAGGDWCASAKQHAPSFKPPVDDRRSDSIDLTLTKVALDLRTANTLVGKADLHFTAKIAGVSTLEFDLEGLPVDSVWLDGAAVPFRYTSPKLRVFLPAGWAQGRAGIARISYKGRPVKDPTGWGGVYFQSNYTYNLGVGFDADPHSFGRAWVPCFDNFVERCAYEVSIHTFNDRPGYANGLLVSESQPAPGERLRQWRLEQEIPAYLACFASGPYASWRRTLNGIPVEIAAAAADTNKVRATFKNLTQALDCYQHWYGPYRWPKVGYSLVPFNSGAMEHATNIAIMRAAIDGTLGQETLWAHELSHHWWGDLATCSTAEDMWLNEGWASYSEHLFTEWVYGRDAYRKAVEDNFLNVLQNAHVSEGGYRAVSGLPHNLTYGTHVYNKGAVVAHNLRGYLGDSLFRVGLRSALEGTKFDDWSSADFRDKLSAATGFDLTDFFQDAVFSPGFTHFSVDSTWVLPNAGPLPLVAVRIKQKVRGAPHLYQNVPLELTFVNAQHQRVYRRGTVSGETTTLQFILPFEPKWTWVNTNGKLAIARAERERLLRTTGTQSFTPAKMDLIVSAAPDSALIRVEHHFVNPDDGPKSNPNGYVLSSRYWTVDGDIPTTFLTNARVAYDGSGRLDQLDTELFARTSPAEDSVVLLYRRSPAQPWQEYPTYQKNILGSNTDRKGQLVIQNLQIGQYAVGKGASIVGTNDGPERRLVFATVSPNPTDGVLRLQAETQFEWVRVYDQNGQKVKEMRQAPTFNRDVSLDGLPTGTYRLVFGTDNTIGTIAVVKQ